MKLLEQACQLEEGDACYELFMLLYSGKVVPKDLARADVFYERSCVLLAPFARRLASSATSIHALRRSWFVYEIYELKK